LPNDIVLRNLEPDYKYVGYLAGRLKTSIQYTSDLLAELKREGVVKRSERILTKGKAGISKKRYYELVKPAEREVKEELKGLKIVKSPTKAEVIKDEAIK